MNATALTGVAENGRESTTWNVHSHHTTINALGAQPFEAHDAPLYMPSGQRFATLHSVRKC
jgi:hypothetical protein